MTYKNTMLSFYKKKNLNIFVETSFNLSNDCQVT